MRILLVAPDDPSLPGLSAEIASINSFHDVTNIVGTVRDVDIADAIAAHPEGWDCFWLATHSGDLGVQISGEVLIADGVGQYLTATRARLCVLNSCASEALARQIIVGTDADMIFTRSDVLDADALRFGSLLAGELAKTDNYRKAFDLAAPQRGKYKYLAAKAAIRSLDMTVSSELQKLGSRVDEGVKSYQEVSRGYYQMTVDAKTDRQAAADLHLKITALQQQVDILRQQSQTRDMREDLRKEDRNMEMAAMGRKIDANVSAPAPVIEPISRYTPTFILLLLLVVLALGVVIFFAGRGFQPVPVGAAILLVGVLAKLLGIHI